MPEGVCPHHRSVRQGELGEKVGAVGMVSDVLEGLANAFDGLTDAFDALVAEVSAIRWGWLALALLCHLLRLGVRSLAWRNVLAASYPEANVRWRSAFGAYAAAAGVNAVIPARGGEVVRIFLMRRRIPGASYATLGSSLLVEAIFDTVMAALLVAWAIRTGVFPDLDVLPRLPPVDWLWIFDHPRVAAAVALAALLAGFLLGLLGARKVDAFRQRVGQGLAVLRTPRLYLTGVAAWQVVEWALRLASVSAFLEAFGMPATLRNALVTQATQSLATLVPLTPGGIGTQQALLVYVFRGEAPTATLLSFSVGMKVALIAVNVVLGSLVLWRMLRTIDPRRAFTAASSDRRPTAGTPE
jgi:uncharacterized membrane protein YbhN (UPF0104 family)